MDITSLLIARKYVDDSLASAIPAPASATVGQTIVVKEVDEEGKPIAWTAADFPDSSQNGEDGFSPIATVAQTDTGAVISITDKNGTTTTTVTNGADGITPHIGENGNWFIGDEDTGIKAGGSGSDDKKKEWVLVFEQDIEALNEDSSNSVTYVEVTQDMDGNPLCCKAFILETRDRTKATENGYNYLNFNYANSVREGSFLPTMYRKGLQATYYIGEPMDNGQRLFQLAYASDRGAQPPMYNGAFGTFGIGFAPNATNPNWGEDITKIGWGSYQNINGMLVRIYALVEG